MQEQMYSIDQIIRSRYIATNVLCFVYTPVQKEAQHLMSNLIN